MKTYTEGPLVVKGVVKKCEISGFIAIGRDREDSLGAPTAYVAYRADAELYASSTDLRKALVDLLERYRREYSTTLDVSFENEPEVVQALKALKRSE